MSWFGFKYRLRNPWLFKRDIEHFWQRRIRGWDNSETYSLDSSLGKHILPRLKKFKELTIAFPGGDITEEEWDLILDKMITAFELVNNDDKWHDLTKEELEMFNDGIQLFAKHYRHLWW